jgi:hypothetical protein
MAVELRRKLYPLHPELFPLGTEKVIEADEEARRLRKERKKKKKKKKQKIKESE